MSYIWYLLQFPGITFYDIQVCVALFAYTQIKLLFGWHFFHSILLYFTSQKHVSTHYNIEMSHAF